MIRDGDDATILAYGSTCRASLEAADLLEGDGIHLRVVNARFAKPVDRDMVADALGRATPVVTVEDHGLIGGFGSAVLETAQSLGLSAASVTRLGIPDRFIAHGSRGGQLAECGLDPGGIAVAVRSALGTDDVIRSGRAHTMDTASLMYTRNE